MGNSDGNARLSFAISDYDFDPVTLPYTSSEYPGVLYMHPCVGDTGAEIPLTSPTTRSYYIITHHAILTHYEFR